MNIEDFLEIPEEKIQYGADNGSVTFQKLLRLADAWREADLTPVFLLVQEEPSVVACVAREKFGRYLN